MASFEIDIEIIDFLILNVNISLPSNVVIAVYQKSYPRAGIISHNNLSLKAIT